MSRAKLLRQLKDEQKELNKKLEEAPPSPITEEWIRKRNILIHNIHVLSQKIDNVTSNTPILGHKIIESDVVIDGDSRQKHRNNSSFNT